MFPCGVKGIARGSTCGVEMPIWLLDKMKLPLEDTGIFGKKANSTHGLMVYLVVLKVNYLIAGPNVFPIP